MSTQYRVLAMIVALPLASAAGQEVVSRGQNLVEVTVTAAGADEPGALRAALRSAVETGAGTFIYSQSQTQDYALVRDTVLARSAGFVQSHRVLSRRRLPDDTTELQISAVVSIKGIEDTWGAVTTLLSQMGRPKVMVFVRERIGNEVQEDSTVQTRIENMLLESGFLLVSKEQLAEIDRRDLQAAVAEDNTARVQAIAKRFGAQLFISGVATSEAGPTGNVGGVELYPYQAQANIRCYRSDTAQLLSSIPGQPTRGVDRVRRSAAHRSLDAQARQIAPRVRADVLRFWQDALAGRGEVQLRIDDCSFRDFSDIRRRLTDLREVKEVTGTFANRTAELSLQTDTPALPLAEAISMQMEEIEITDVSQNVIKARLNR